MDEPEKLENLREFVEKDGKPFLEISSAANKNIKELVFAVSLKLDEIKEDEANAVIIEIDESNAPQIV